MDTSGAKSETRVDIPKPWPPRWFLDYDGGSDTEDEDRDPWMEAELEEDFE